MRSALNKLAQRAMTLSRNSATRLPPAWLLTRSSHNAASLSSPYQTGSLTAHSKLPTLGRKFDDDVAVHIGNQGRTLAISFSSSQCSSTFHAPWLWVQDPKYVHPKAGQQLRSLGQYPKDVLITQAEVIHMDPDEADKKYFPLSPPGSFHSRGGVYFQRKKVSDDEDDNPAFPERVMLKVTWSNGEESFYDMQWLERMNYDAPPATSTEFSTRITKDLAIGAKNNPKCVPIPTLDYEEVLTVVEQGSYRAIRAIIDHGAVLIKQAPKVDRDHFDATVAHLGQVLSGGRLSHGYLYGDTFHVRNNSKDANNLAYTSVALPPHQDLTYYQSKPFLQLLHCVSAASIGGASVLVDGMAAAEELRRVAPHLFDILCRVEATFLKQRRGADMVSFKPHIVKCPTTNQVIEVNWSPPFEGPLQVPAQLVEDYVMAYQAYQCMVDNHLENGKTMLPPGLEQELRDYANKYTWEHVMQPGDILIFNNQRMLHGRRFFELNHGEDRHLVGCYTDAMETLSYYRLLLRERGGGDEGRYGVRNVGNGTRGSSL